MPWYKALGLIAGIFLAFSLIHSLCVTMNVKRLVARLFGENFVRGLYRLLYTVFSIITTVVAVYLITLIPDRHLFDTPAWLRLPMHGVQFLGLLIGLRAFQFFDLYEFLGLKQAWRYMARKEAKGDIEGISMGRLVTSGIYGVVRNPMYLGGILLFSFNPYITRNWLSVSALADAYFVYGAFIEERRMLRQFGEEYRRYMKAVPLIIPSRKFLKNLSRS